MATAQIYISCVFVVLFSQTRGRGRSQLNLFQPRAVQRNPATASPSTKQPSTAAGDQSAGTDNKCSSLHTTADCQTTSAAAAASSSSNKKMSNDAFRAMFLSNK